MDAPKHRDKRALKKFLRSHDTISGDAASDATQYANLAALLAQGGGEIASTQLKKQEEAKKKAAVDAATKEVKDATDALGKIDATTNPGSYAAAQARLADAKKRLADLMTASPAAALTVPGQPGKGASGKSGIPSWVMPVAIGVGVLGAVAVIYKLVKKK